MFVKLGSIGDIVHTLPILNEVRRLRQDAQIDWVVDKRSAEILRLNPMINNLLEFDSKNFHLLRPGKAHITTKMQSRSWPQLIRRLRADNYDLAIDFQGLLKSGAIAAISGAKEVFGFEKQALREPAARFFYSQKVSIPRICHVIDKNFLLAQTALGEQLNTRPLEFPIFTDNSHKEEADFYLEKVKKPFALLNPGGGWVTKLWRAENFGHLADELFEKAGLESIITAGPDEAELVQRACNAAKKRPYVAKLSLKGFYRLAKHAAVYVGGDTGPTHIAIAAKTPVVALFGPTEWFRNGSLNPSDICVERTDITCRTDCYRRSCGKWICMDINVETVLNAVITRINAASGQVQIS
ncbi:MAG TPA: lipopolysaccharide heptosyltransferase I [Pyrinomonadaceae bacterium]|nr:lipopolysaccharide heptosyltransferase I [Pyrinomonadaceae bacterium]